MIGAGTDGREARFRRLYDDHAGAVLTYAARRVAAPGDAGDVVADVFVVAWRRLDDVPAGSDARPWLLGVARRVLANWRRSDDRRSRLGRRLRDHLERAAGPEDDQAGDEVRAALASLDDEDRELLRLTAWDGLSPGEIAVVFDIPPATARTRLHRARARLRRELTTPQGAVGSRGEDR